MRQTNTSGTQISKLTFIRRIVRGIGVVIVCLPLSGCVTIAHRDKGETLTLWGWGKATWQDGVSIEGKPPIDLSGLHYDKD